MNSKQNLIISLSGGKDSTALLLMALEKGYHIHSVVFFDTGWEFPQMYEHLDLLEKQTKIKIVKIQPKVAFDEMIIHHSWPQPWYRKCTGEKRDTIKTYLGKHKPYVLCIGMAADEKHRALKGTIRKHKDCFTRFPLIEWDITEKDALNYCKSKGYDWGGLYDHFDRASCFCCPLRKIGDYRKTKKYYPELWQRMLEMDTSIIKNRGFRGRKTVHNLDRRFAEEDRQLPLFGFDDATVAVQPYAARGQAGSAAEVGKDVFSSLPASELNSYIAYGD